MSARHERRLRLFKIDGEVLVGLFTRDGERHFAITSGFPPDADLEAMYVGIDFNTVYVEVSSQEFEPVPEGEAVPYGDPILIRTMEDGR